MMQVLLAQCRKNTSLQRSHVIKLWYSTFDYVSVVRCDLINDMTMGQNKYVTLRNQKIKKKITNKDELWTLGSCCLCPKLLVILIFQ